MQTATIKNTLDELDRTFSATLAYPSGGDVTVSIAVDPSLVDTYNARHNKMCIRDRAQTARVTLKVQNASLGQVMDEIKNQTRYLFINQDVKDLNNHKVSLNVSDKAIAEVLDQILPLSISVIASKKQALLFSTDRKPHPVQFLSLIHI